MTRDDCERLAASFARAFEGLGENHPAFVNGMKMAAILVATEMDAHGRMDPALFLKQCGIEPDPGRFKYPSEMRKRRIKKLQDSMAETATLLAS